MSRIRCAPGGAALSISFALVSLLASSLAATDARASGIDSAPLIGTGQSSPTTRDAAAIYWNPAQLAFLTRTELLLGAGVIIGNIQYERERRGTYQTPDTLQYRLPLRPENVDPTKTGTAEEVSTTPMAPTGNAFLAVPVIDNRLVVAGGIYVPYAAALDLPMEGAQAWQMQQALIASFNVTLGAGVRAMDNLAFGAGVSYVGGTASIRKLQDFGSLQEFAGGLASPAIGQANDFGPNAPPEMRELDVLSRPFSLTNAFSHGITFNAGVAYQPTKAINLGLTYQHGTKMRYSGDFALDMSDEFFTQDLASQGLRYKPLVEGEAELSFWLPKRITLGASYDATPKIRVDGFVSYITYSDLDAFVVETKSPDLAQPELGIGDTVKVTLPRDWNDTVWVEANGRYRLNEDMLVSVGLGYQSPASPDSTIDASSPDGHRIIGALGGSYAVSERISLYGDARLQGILPREVTESTNDLGNGTYRLFIASVAGHIKAVF